MGGRPLVEYEIKPSFEVIDWCGEKGEVVNIGRIAFPPRSAKQNAFSGRKVSFIFRGRGYRDPYSGFELRKGHVIALPVDVLSDVKITEVKLGSAWISKDFSDAEIEVIVYYEKEHKGERVRSRIKRHKSVSIASIENKSVVEVLSSLFSLPGEKIKYSNGWLGSRKRRDGYIIRKYELHIMDGKFVVKEEREENLYYAPIEILIQKLDRISATVYGYFTTSDSEIKERRSIFHPCLDDYFTVKPSESVRLFNMNSRKLRELLESGKIKIEEIIMRKVHSIFDGERQWRYVGWNGEMSFDEFLEEIKKYDIKRLEEQIEEKKKRLEEIESFMHYYANVSKEQIIQKFHRLWEVIDKDIVNIVDDRVWVKIINISITEASYSFSIVIPKKQVEIECYFFEAEDEYSEDEGDYEEHSTNWTEEQLWKQEIEKKQEIERLSKEIEQLVKKTEEIKQKDTRELYDDIVAFFSYLKK